MRGMSSVVMNVRKLGIPPLAASAGCGLPSGSRSVCVGVMSRVRFVFGIATTIISGRTNVALIPVPRIWSRPVTEWKCASPSYSDTTYLPKRYPVLYLLDGDAHFHSVTGLLQILGTGINGTFVLPEMIVVSLIHISEPTRLLSISY